MISTSRRLGADRGVNTTNDTSIVTANMATVAQVFS